MPIIANEIIIAGKQGDNPPKQVGNIQLVKKTEEEQHHEGTALIVNGKRKTISKKSAYLMDMLALDND
jgi:hypothetical protein